MTQVLADMFHVLAGESASQTHDKLSRKIVCALGVQTPLCDNGGPSSEQIDLFEPFIFFRAYARILEEKSVKLTSHIVYSFGRI